MTSANGLWGPTTGCRLERALGWSLIPFLDTLKCSWLPQDSVWFTFPIDLRFMVGTELCTVPRQGMNQKIAGYTWPCLRGV